MSSRKTSEFASAIDPLAPVGLPPEKGMGRRERRAAETRLKLLRCALQLFAERGYQNVTVEDITESADVGKGTFFNYFASKDHVLSVMAEVQLGRVREALEAAEAGKRPIRSVLKNFFTKVCEEPGRSPDLARALLTAFLSSTIRDLLAQKFSDGRRMIGRVLELGQQSGEIDPKLKPEQMALHLQQSFIGTLLLWALHGEQKLQTVAEASFQHFWRAISVKN
jgi:AcrR family transcriptional regulator